MTCGTIGDQRAQATFDAPSGTIFLNAPSHAAGVVDVIVTNPYGLADTLVGAYTYVSPLVFGVDTKVQRRLL